jgi:hypothetical protein
VVATLAKELGDDAVILSADRDFFRYPNPYSVYPNP